MNKYKVEFIEKEADLRAFCQIVAEKILNGDITVNDIYDRLSEKTEKK